MATVTVKIDGVAVSVTEGTTILNAALQAGIYIPHLCSHPDLPPVDALPPADFVYRGNERLENKSDTPYEGCQLCVVSIEGQEELQRACNTPVADGMVISVDTPEALEYRRERLMFILAKHPHACLTCAQREGCARFPCSTNVPEKERCCANFGNCELQKVAEYVGIKPETPRYVHENIPVLDDEPLFTRDYNLCIGCTRCVRACRELRGVEAIDFVIDEDGRVKVGTVSPNLKDSACRFCTACVEVCPTGALTDKEEFKEVPCQATCPAGIDIPAYINLVSEGKYGEAVAVIREKVTLPLVLGYICPHSCELKCRRAELDEAIAIRTLKRFAAEHDDKSWQARIKTAPATGKKVAVIGAGPGGLTAAYYLTRAGHMVTIYEASPKPGGMMRTGIPRFLLPEEVLEEDINEILGGIELKVNTPVADVGGLKSQGYDAVLIAIGMQLGKKLSIPGSDLADVCTGIDFLREASEGKGRNLAGKRVLVLGGGGVACDVARTAVRLGAAHVAMSCLESAETMPAFAHDIRQSKEEGIEILPARIFKQITQENACVAGVECQNVKWMKFDEAGRLQLETYPDSEHVIAADVVIFATGQALERQFATDNKLELTPGGVLKTSPETMETGIKGIFACGEASTGPSSVVDAIASGRKAASAIDVYLGGEGKTEEVLHTAPDSGPYLGRMEEFVGMPRVEPPEVAVEERQANFTVVELPWQTEQALAESQRCLRCNLRFKMSRPVLPPRKRLWVEFTAENVNNVPEIEGVYQLLDEREQTIYIKGAINLRRELSEQMETKEKARYFMYEEFPMYTKRESELLQQYLAEHGEMPEGNRELDDLF